jgi:PucR C-terminal helix-turn-helix domain/GGDEF-like domain
MLSRLLAGRRLEIEQAALTRIYAIADPAEAPDPEYAEGLRAAVAAAIGYGLVAIERGEERAPAIPAVLLTQARLAARSGISLDTVLRRYVSGQALLGDFLIEEAERADLLDRNALQRLLRSQAVLFDRLLVAVSEEHAREEAPSFDSAERRRAQRVERLLAGELIDVAALGYELDCNHVGVVIKGGFAVDELRDVAARLDRRLLVVHRKDETHWAWFGSRRRAAPAELAQYLSCSLQGRAMALGEPSHGLAGWRLTHRQARAAFPIALRRSHAPVPYADVALLASMLQDDLLAASLHKLYLLPLEGERDGGEVLRETLRAYLATGRNASSAAETIGVSRDTIANRLRTVEQRIGRSFDSCASEVAAALDLAEIRTESPPRVAVPETVKR